MSSKISPILLLATIAIATAAVTLYATKPVTHNGKIKTIGINAYSDAACTIVLTGIDWGNMTPGETKTTTYYVKNTGNRNITLSYTNTDWLFAWNESSWVPSFPENYMTTSWDYDGHILQRYDVVTIQHTLVIAANITGVDRFQFLETIYGTEVV